MIYDRKPYLKAMGKLKRASTFYYYAGLGVILGGAAVGFPLVLGSGQSDLQFYTGMGLLVGGVLVAQLVLKPRLNRVYEAQHKLVEHAHQITMRQIYRSHPDLFNPK